MTEIDDDALAINSDVLSAKFKLSPMETKFLHLMLAKRNVSKQDLPELRYALRQLIYTLRKKLSKIGGVYVVNSGDGRYSIPRLSKLLLARELGKP